MATKREPLRSVTYRRELGDVAADRHDETGPQRIPTAEAIDAVLADLPTHDEVAAVDQETAPVEPVEESEAS